MGKLVFTSYAHNNLDEYLIRFVKELAQELEQVVTSLQPDDIVFLDRDSIKTGDDWMQQLSTAVISCKLCVAICSPAFVASHFCGKELQVFLQRLARWEAQEGNGPVVARPIFPILWITKVPPPAVLKPFQRTDGDFPDEYATVGLRTMYRLRRYAEKRKELVTALANRIADALSTVDLPDGDEIPDFAYIPSAFHEQERGTRYGLAVVPLVKARIHATPFAGEASLFSLIQAAIGERIPWRSLEPDRDLGVRLRQAADGGEATVVVTDLETLGDPLYKQLVDVVNENLGRHAAIAVIRHERTVDPAADSQVAITVQSAFDKAVARGAIVNFTSVRSADDLSRRLQEDATSLRLKLVEADPARKAQDAALVAHAAAHGVPIERLSTVAGPGASSR